MTAKLQAALKQYVYSFDALDRVPDGPTSCAVAPRRLLSGETLATGKSTTVGPVLSGSHVHVAWLLKQRGTGSKLHTHPNEQFNIVLEGTMLADIDGQHVQVPPRHAIHMPTGVVHATMASGEGDVLFFVAKDTRHGLAGPPIDGIEDGPRFLPGFGPQR